MARPRAFSEEHVLEQAMYQFWRGGFCGTSIVDLEKSTGLSRISLYNAFGGKDSLFLLALQMYRDRAETFFKDPEFASGGLESVRSLFESLSTRLPKDAPEQYGCMMLNTILDIDVVTDEARATVESCRCTMIDGFSRALKTASDKGIARASRKEIRERAEFLVGAMWGIRITSRLKGDVAAVKGATRTVVQVIGSWRTVPSSSR
ncbi:MAG: TetR family transcriptional regulator [Pseudomonadota bacterium]